MPALVECLVADGNDLSQQTQSICITFVQRRPSVFDVGPTLYNCYRPANVLCLVLWDCTNLRISYRQCVSCERSITYYSALKIQLLASLPTHLEMWECQQVIWHGILSLITNGHQSLFNYDLAVRFLATSLPILKFWIGNKAVKSCLLNKISVTMIKNTQYIAPMSL